jgi:hypothetical protein
MRIFFTFAISALICSCTMQPKEVNSMSDVARITGTLPRNKATVFVHLPASIQTLNGKVSLDGRIVAELPKRSFTKLTLTPGFHTIDMKFPALTGPNCEDYKFNFERDTVYHVALVEGPRNPTLGSLVVDEFLYSAAHLRPVHASDGIQLTRHENYVPATNQ